MNQILERQMGDKMVCDDLSGIVASASSLSCDKGQSSLVDETPGAGDL